MADTHHAVRRIRSGVQIECPARLALFFQALAHGFRRIFCKACFGAHIPADGAAAFGKQFCGCISWASVLISWARSVRFQRGIWVIGWVAHHWAYRSGRRWRVRSRLWRPRQASILLWSPVSSTGGMAWPSHTSGRVNWGIPAGRPSSFRPGSPFPRPERRAAGAAHCLPPPGWPARRRSAHSRR